MSSSGMRYDRANLRWVRTLIVYTSAWAVGLHTRNSEDYPIANVHSS